MFTLFRLQSETWNGVIVPASLSLPSCSVMNWALVISVSMSTSRTCWIWVAPIGLSNMTRVPA
jgi:hypothetical protein